MQASRDLGQRFDQSLKADVTLVDGVQHHRQSGLNPRQPEVGPPDVALPSPLLTLVPGERAFLETVMTFCDTIGVTYQNPHTFAIAVINAWNRVVIAGHKHPPRRPSLWR